MSIEDLIAQANAKGWKLNNLFQLDSGGYMASLRDAELGYEFGRGHTAVEALTNALNPKKPGERLTPQVNKAHSAPQGRPRLNMENIF